MRLLGCALSLLVLLAAASPPTARQQELLRKSDIGSFAPSSFRARLRLEGAKGNHEVEIWRSGAGKMLVRFLDPAEHGRYMVLLDRELWLITPDARKPVKLKPSHRLYGGATVDEVLGVRLSELYDIESAAEEDSAAGRVVAFDLHARAAEVPFPKVHYVVRESTQRPVSAVFRLADGRPATSVEFLVWNERPVYARRVVFNDLLRKTVRGAVEVLELEERRVPEGLFDLTDPSARNALESTSPSTSNR
jgi:hypothetical protein